MDEFWYKIILGQTMSTVSLFHFHNSIIYLVSERYVREIRSVKSIFHTIKEMTDSLHFPGSSMELLQRPDLSLWPAVSIRWTKTSTCLIFPYGCNSLHHSDDSLLISCFFWQQHIYTSSSQTNNRALP